ncbi:ABC transporter permease [Gordonia sp. NPDC003424]
MIGAIDAERIKLLSTRSPYWSVGIVVVLTLGVAGLTASLSSGPADPALFLMGLNQFGVLVLMIMAILAVTNEYRFGTIRTSFLAVPRRSDVLGAKAVVYGGLSAALTLILVIASMLLVGALSDSGVDWGSSDMLRQIWGSPLFVIGCVLFGIGLGALVRQTAAGIVVMLLWILVAESILGVLPRVGDKIAPFLPFANGARFLGGPDGSVGYHWNIYGSLIYFLVIAVAVFVAGIVVTKRRDA